MRHTREGIAENSLSKSTLICAVHTIVEEFQKTAFYFPSYEIFLDELRYNESTCCTAGVRCTVYCVLCALRIVQEIISIVKLARLWIDVFLSVYMYMYLSVRGGSGHACENELCVTSVILSTSILFPLKCSTIMC